MKPHSKGENDPNQVEMDFTGHENAPSDTFLNDVAVDVLNKHGANLSAVTVLLPTHRACVYFREALQNNAKGVIWSPEVTTLKDWVFNRSELTLVEPLEQVLLLFEVYQGIGGEQTFDEFISTAQTMLNDFDDVDTNMVNAKSFFTYLEQLQSMKVYAPGEELSEYSLQYKKFWGLFRNLYFGLREKLIAQGKGYSGMLYRSVAENTSLKTGGTTFYIAGFNRLSKSEEQIINHLRAICTTEIIFDADKYYIEDAYQEAGLFYRKYKQQWRLKSEKWVNDFIRKKKKHINVVGVAKNIGQAKVVADILRNKLRLNGQNERETAVIIPDERLLNTVVNSIPGNISSLNISMGYPLSESPIATLLFNIFSLHNNAQRYINGNNKRLRFYYRDVFDILRHPYSPYFIDDKKQVDELMNNLRKFNRMVVSYSELSKAMAGSQFEKLFWYTEDVGEYLEKLLDLVNTLSEKLVPQAQAGETKLSVDVELLFHVHNILNNVSNVQNKDARQIELNTATLRKLLSDSIKTIRIPFEGEPVRGLQIMGTLETRCLDFKNVIILSMNEGIFPTDKMSQSYIPYEMRKEFLTTHKEKDADSAYLFYRLLQRAENVYLLYNTESDELGGGERSRFILQLQHELQSKNNNAVINDLVYSVDPPPALAADRIDIAKDTDLVNKMVEWLKRDGISPSAINTYIQCSLKYYLRYEAHLREKDEIEESIEAATLGEAVHYVLENLYKQLPANMLTVDEVERIIKDKDLIAQLLTEAFEKRFDKESLAVGKNFLLYRVSLKLIHEFLKQERYNLKVNEQGKPVHLIMLENKMEQGIKAGNFDIKVQGKVDRVESRNGVISIADYKTGSPVGSSIKSDDVSLFATDPKYGKAMQLLTYAWLYWKSNGSGNIPIRSGIYWLRDAAQGFDSLKLDKEEFISAEVLKQFETVLGNVLAELLNAEIPFSKTTDVKRCTYCEFVRICRRN